ncbi:tryptophan synthase subunit alpha [bacterium]|nr:tryptophan synthase subunit alpha [bacterium]
MSKIIAQAFKEKALIAYVTLGDPTISDTITYCKALIDSGVSMIEIGLPFSDPIADGPIIQASHQTALLSGEDVSVRAALDVIKILKEYAPNVPIIIMAATNIIMQFGYRLFFQEATQASCNGILMPDCSIEMTQIIKYEDRVPDVPIINLVSPLCNEDRLKTIISQSEGFVYLLSSTGTTGERDSFSQQLEHFISRIKQIKNIPVAIGFGVSKPAHYKSLTQFSEGVIIGSHFVKLLKSKATIQEGIAAVSNRVKEFKAFL